MKKTLSLLLLSILFVMQLFAVGAKEEKIKEINISYVADPYNLPLIIMKERGFAEKAFQTKGIRVNYFELNSGAKQSEAIAAGSLHIASVINTVSVILANAGGNEVEIISLFSNPDKMFALLNKDGTVRSAVQLRGKTIAGPKGSVLHEMLVAALAKNGMTIDDVKFINMNIPNGIAAMLSGKVDCCLAAGASVINAVKGGAEVVFTCNGLVEPLLVSACGKEFYKKYPDMVKTFIEAMNESVQWMKSNIQEAMEIGAKVQDISIDDAWKLYSWCDFESEFSQKHLDAIENDITFMLDNEMINHPVDKMSFISEMLIK